MANGSIYDSDSTAAFAFDSAAAYSCDSIAAADTTATLPADSAFLTGKLVTEPHSQTAAADRQSTDMYGDMIADGIIALMAAVFIIFMKGILNVMPMVLGSLFRWKENLNIEDSVKMCRERNRFALILFPAFCVTTARYGVWSPSFIGDSGLLTSIPVTAAALVVFLLASASVSERNNLLSFRRIAPHDPTNCIVTKLPCLLITLAARTFLLFSNI